MLAKSYEKGSLETFSILPMAGRASISCHDWQLIMWTHSEVRSRQDRLSSRTSIRKKRYARLIRSILNEIDVNKQDAFQDHRPIAVNVQTLTDYHSDADHMKSYSPVLPL